MEKELAEEKEKVRSLEAELVRVRTEAIADFKKSQEYEELLVVEYDVSFSDTFKSCWEAIIEELGSKIDEVTLEKFLVPLVPRKTPASPVDLEETGFGDSHPWDPQEEGIKEGVRSPVAEDAAKKDAEEEDEEIPEKATEDKEGDDVFDDGLP